MRRCGRIRAALTAGVVALGVVSLAAAQAPNPTVLVLQPADMPPSFKTESAPHITTSDGDLSVSSSRYGRVSGAEASYSLTLLGGFPMGVTSRAVIFKDATGAHGAFLDVSAKLTRLLSSQGSVASIGQEGRRFNVLILGDRVMWRQGNVLAEIHVGDGRGPGSDAMEHALRQQNRIAALVPASDPGPPVVVKPVIGKPVAQPAQPRTGRSFKVTFRVTWSNDGSALTSASIATKTSIASKAVPHRYSFGAGRLTMSLTVPRTAKGKQLKVTATVRAEKRATTKIVTYKVR
jgi:hypothetical protein